MRRTLFFVVGLFSVISPGILFAADVSTLTVYTYDSLVGPKSLGAWVQSKFEEKCKCKIRYQSFGDGIQLVKQIDSEIQKNKKTNAEVIWGLDQQTWARIRDLKVDGRSIWSQWHPRGWSQIGSQYKVGPGFIPYDYSVYAFMANVTDLKKQGLEKPKRLSDLLTDQWKRKIILQDPRASTPGLAFLLWTRKVYPDLAAWNQFWTKLKSQWLTLTPGWSQAYYGVFLKSEAPLVWSYITSEAYHRAHQQPGYEAVIFEDAHPLQIEGMALQNGESELARSFVELILSKTVQEKIPETNWMFPVRDGVDLPPSFRALARPKKLFKDSELEWESVLPVLSSWQSLVE